MLGAAAVLAAAPAREYPVRAVPHGQVELRDGFWKDKLGSGSTPTDPSFDLPLADADRLAATVGPDKLRAVDGNGEIELALIRLWIATGRPRYYETARFLLDERSRAAIPRNLLLHSAMTDVAALENDKAYLDAVTRSWREMVTTWLPLTGGAGCDAPAHAAWSARMFLTTGRAEFVDVLERTLYNELLASAGTCDRANVTRTIAQMPGYIYAHQRNTLFVNLYAGSRARVPMSLGDVTIAQETNYPWDGDVEIRVEPAQPREFVVAFREPKWLGDTPLESDRYRYADKRRQPPPDITVNGRTVHMLGANGYITIGRRWERGDVVRIRFPMQPRRVVAGPGVEEPPGKTLFERGPLVYVLDAASRDADVPPDARLDSSFRRGLLGGVQVVTGDAVRNGRRTRFTAVPYFAASLK